ncbi:envelope stress sensor histidine kinase CpxA [Thaumasiovibrio subtropicus]|uniref:envelope stress sensor histidine kinase CpxA n=1 Tax=Thaumasiovibrio subtropicus TaxID=1891207 RepID=UPI000B358175|nr:envelope stress sensor histidine kinase CpxA [Thaumasiovibrio subtropicus]
MNLPRISSLYGRIFATFWFTLLIVVIGLLAVPQFDPRSEHNIPREHFNDVQKAMKRMSSLPLSLEDKIALIRQRQREFSFKAYFTDDEGESIGKGIPQSRILSNFASLSYDPSEPQQKLYGHWMVSGPFLVQADDGSAYMYLSRRWQRPPPWFLRILDKPFQLLLVTMLISTPLLLWLAWAVTQPARRLQQAAEKVSRGELETDPKLEKGPSEFVNTGRSFNHMVSSLNQMISGQQRLLSDISHELRSPLTRLRMATALAVRKQGESNELSRIETEAERLEQMIAELLELSRMQVNSHSEYELTDAESVWLEMLKDAEFEAEQNGKRLQWHGLKPWSLHAHPALLCSALENVARNAIKYANQSVTVNFDAQPQQLVIHVCDDGPGVPASERDDIFRPFYRVSTARDRDSGGTGLGLSITESAVRQHNGVITASESESGGLCVTMTLPLNG